MKDKIKKIIKDSYNKNRASVPWSGMHDEAVEKIMKIIEKKT
tara:strand:+ start:270 stop:395 length:126 start_codon:yes stop_codon:yes gene_type:complete